MNTHRHTIEARKEAVDSVCPCVSVSLSRGMKRSDTQCPVVTHSLSPQSDINDPLSFLASPLLSPTLSLLTLHIWFYFPLTLSWLHFHTHSGMPLKLKISGYNVSNTDNECTFLSRCCNNPVQSLAMLHLSSRRKTHLWNFIWPSFTFHHIAKLLSNTFYSKFHCRHY